LLCFVVGVFVHFVRRFTQEIDGLPQLLSFLNYKSRLFRSGGSPQHLLPRLQHYNISMGRRHWPARLVDGVDSIQVLYGVKRTGADARRQSICIRRSCRLRSLADWPAITHRAVPRLLTLL
jgi:hypothetical protein